MNSAHPDSVPPPEGGLSEDFDLVLTALVGEHPGAPEKVRKAWRSLSTALRGKSGEAAASRLAARPADSIPNPAKDWLIAELLVQPGTPKRLRERFANAILEEGIAGRLVWALATSAQLTGANWSKEFSKKAISYRAALAERLGDDGADPTWAALTLRGAGHNWRILPAIDVGASLGPELQEPAARAAKFGLPLARELILRQELLQFVAKHPAGKTIRGTTPPRAVARTFERAYDLKGLASISKDQDLAAESELRKSIARICAGNLKALEGVHRKASSLRDGPPSSEGRVLALWADLAALALSPGIDSSELLGKIENQALVELMRAVAELGNTRVLDLVWHEVVSRAEARSLDEASWTGLEGTGGKNTEIGIRYADLAAEYRPTRLAAGPGGGGVQAHGWLSPRGFPHEFERQRRQRDGGNGLIRRWVKEGADAGALLDDLLSRAESHEHILWALKGMALCRPDAVYGRLVGGELSIDPRVLLVVAGTAAATWRRQVAVLEIESRRSQVAVLRARATVIRKLVAGLEDDSPDWLPEGIRDAALQLAERLEAGAERLNWPSGPAVGVELPAPPILPAAVTPPADIDIKLAELKFDGSRSRDAEAALRQSVLGWLRDIAETDESRFAALIASIPARPPELFALICDVALSLNHEVGLKAVGLVIESDWAWDTWVSAVEGHSLALEESLHADEQFAERSLGRLVARLRSMSDRHEAAIRGDDLIGVVSAAKNDFWTSASRAQAKIADWIATIQSSAEA